MELPHNVGFLMMKRSTDPFTSDSDLFVLEIYRRDNISGCDGNNISTGDRPRTRHFEFGLGFLNNVECSDGDVGRAILLGFVSRR